MRTTKYFAVFCMLLPAALAFGSTAGALRDYKAGNYDEALKEYQKLLQRNTNDPRLHFNAGAAAYRQKSFAEAAKEFDSALSSPDLRLQGQSYYNRGNSLFRLGEQIPDPSKKSEAWKGALKDFESSAKLNTQDPDAKYNYEFVKRKLEELKQQQQQQSKSDQKQDQNQDQQQQQNQQNQNSSKDQNQQEQAKQDQSEQKQESGQQNQQAQQQKQEEQKPPSPSEQQQKEQQQSQQQNQEQANQSSGQPQDKTEGKEKEAAAALGQMTPEQARQLLDAQKSEEHLLQLKPNKKPTDRSRPFKDW